MTDVEEPPAEEPVEAEEPAPAPEPEPAPEMPETPVEAPLPARWLAAARVMYTDAAGNEFFCGPGEAIPDDYVGQVDAESVTAG